MEFVVADSKTPLPKKLVLGKRDNLRQCEVLIGIEIIRAELAIQEEIASISKAYSLT